MRTAYLSKHFHGPLGFLCAICFVLSFPLLAQTQNYNFAGAWQFNSIISGPGAPWWERGALTVAQDGTFTGSATQSNGASDSPSGAFSISSNGISMSLNGQFSTSLCMMDSLNSMITCVATLPNGASDLLIVTQQSSSNSLANLAGTWQGGLLASGLTSSWEQVSETISPDGAFTETYTKSDGTTASTSGTLAISSNGIVTCASGACLDPTFASFINPTATDMVGTSGAASASQDANLFVLTRQTASAYSIANLVGIWEENSIASGPGAPWWQNGFLYINTDGTCSLTSIEYNGTSNTQNGSVSISPTGLITLDLGATALGYVDPNMDVMVLTSTWPDGATHQISVLTNGSAAALGMGASATWSTGETAPAGPDTGPVGGPDTGPVGGPYSSPVGGPDTGPVGGPYSSPVGGASASPGEFGAPQTTTMPPSSFHGPDAAPSLSHATKTNQEAEGMHAAASPEQTTLPSGSTGVSTVAATSAPPAISPPQTSQVPKPPTAPGSPTIVLVTPGNSQALINFKLPANDGGRPITHCTVTAQPGGITATRPGSPIRISNLQNGEAYTFQVTAANEVGAGPLSQPSMAVTPGRAPDAPQITSVKAGSGLAQVTFTPPASNGGSNITSYTVASNRGQKASGSSSPITVTGLAAGTAYTFTVTATNQIGPGSPSSPSKSVTPW